MRNKEVLYYKRVIDNLEKELEAYSVAGVSIPEVFELALDAIESLLSDVEELEDKLEESEEAYQELNDLIPIGRRYGLRSEGWDI